MSSSGLSDIKTGDRRVGMSVFALLTMALLLGGSWMYRHEAERALVDQHQDLAAISALRVWQVQRWRWGRLADVTVASKHPVLIEAANASRRGATAARIANDVRAALGPVSEAYGYSDAALFARDGRLLVALHDSADDSNPATQRAVRSAVARGAAVMSEFFETDDSVRVDVAAPIRDTGGRVQAVLLLRSRASDYLFPMLEASPSIHGAETVLAEQIGGDVVRLNDRSDGSRASIADSASISHTELPTVQAALGHEGAWDGRDSRGIPIIADLRRVPGSPWFIVIQVDANEMLAIERAHSLLILACVMLGILMVGTAAIAVYHKRQRLLVSGLAAAIDHDRATQDALVVNKERLRLALEAARMGPFEIDVATNVITVSPRYAALLGYDSTSFPNLSEPKDARVHPEDRDAVRAAYEDCLRGRTPTYVAEFRELDGAGQWRWISSVGQIVESDPTGKPTRIAGLHRDITEHKLADAALRDSEERYRTLIEWSPEAIAVHRGGRVLYGNPAALELFGAASVNELVGTSLLDRVHPDFRGIVVARIQRAAEEGTAAPLAEETLLKLDGTAMTVEVSNTLITYDGLPAIFVSMRDITARKQTDAAIRLKSAALEAAANAIVITDRKGVIEWTNTAFTTITGHGADDAIGQRPGDLLKSGTHDQTFYRDLWDTILAGKVWHGEVVNKRKDSTLYTEDMTITPLMDARGEITHFIAVKQDITQRKLMEEQFRQAQKMESIGRLAGGVAHDFNNMLSVILGHAELAMFSLEPTQPLHAELSEIYQAARRSADLTRQLLTFARKQTVTPTVLDLNETVENSLRMLKRLIGEDIQLTFWPERKLWRITMDASQMDQILANLCVNARDAIADVGTMVIATANCRIDAEFCSAHAEAAPGDYVRLTVTDDGCGMSREVLARIFEPFFSTKTVGEGTGLGLASIYGAVQQNNGFITVSSELGQGTTFAIYLPRLLDPVLPAQMHDSPAPSRRGWETILLVDDEPAVLQVVTRGLQAKGYRVLAAHGPAEALRLAHEHADEVHLLLTDVIMPDMNGNDLANTLASLYPKLRHLFMSGYTADIIAKRMVFDGDAPIIDKPFTIAALAAKVREVLDRTAV